MSPWLQLLNAAIIAALLGYAFKKVRPGFFENLVLFFLLADMAWVAFVAYNIALVQMQPLGAVGWAIAAAVIDFFIAATVDAI